MNRKIIATASLVLVTGVFSGWAQDSGGTGFAPPTGLRYGPLTLHPSLEFSYGWDSNPSYLRSGAHGQSELQIQPMLDMLIQGNNWGIDARAWLLYNWYLGGNDYQRSENDKDHYGESIDAYYITPRGVKFTISEFYEYQNRNDSVMLPAGGGQFYNGSFQDRQSYNVAGDVEVPVGERTRVNGGVSYSGVKYDANSLYGWDETDVNVGLARRISALTDWRLDGTYLLQNSDGADNDSQGYRLVTGIGSSPTAKSSYRVEGGIMGYGYNGEDIGSIFGWTYDVSGNWLVTRQLALHLNGRSYFQPSETDQNDFSQVQEIMAGFDYRLTRRLTDSFNGGYRREQWKYATEYQDRRHDNEMLVYNRLSYELNRYATMFVGIEFTKNNSNIHYDAYNRFFVNTGVNLHF